MKQTITIENYKSKYFPYIAKWKCGSVEHSDVFVRKEYAIEHMKARFKSANIVDKTIENEEKVSI